MSLFQKTNASPLSGSPRFAWVSSASLLFLFFALLPLPNAEAAVLAWDNVVWTAGSLTNSYDLNGDGITDVTVTIAATAGITWNSGAPVGVSGNAPFTDQGSGNGGPGSGGLPAGKKLLSLWMDTHGDATQQVTVTVAFKSAYAAGVTNAAFTIHDIDSGAYTDQVRSIVGLSLSGTSVFASTVTNAGSTSNTVSGSGATFAITANGGSANNNTSQGDGTITFGNTPIKQFSFVYGNPAGTTIGSGQHIQLGDISFTPAIPEMHPGLAAVAVCGVALACRRFRFQRS